METLTIYGLRAERAIELKFIFRALPSQVNIRAKFHQKIFSRCGDTKCTFCRTNRKDIAKYADDDDDMTTVSQ